MVLKPKMTAARIVSVPFKVRLSPRVIDLKLMYLLRYANKFLEFFLFEIRCPVNLLSLNWCLLGVEMDLGHAHKKRFWYLLGVLSKFSDEHPRHFYRGVPPPPPSAIKIQTDKKQVLIIPYDISMFSFAS